MNTITWLHLSDFHFRAGEQDVWNENIVLDALLDDVRGRMAEDGLRPDFVVVSGDLAFSGQPAEYDLAGTFFDDLLQATGLGKERLFLVPGNHDVDREAISRGAQAVTDALDDRDTANAVLSTPGDRRLVLARFQGYAGFVNSYLAGYLSFTDKDYYYVKILDLAGQRLAVLGLNSAWVAASDQDKAQGLLLGERQTRTALRQADGAGATLKLALLHHPLDWLREFDQNDSGALLLDRCQYLLHGHLHQTATTQLTSPDGVATVLACGACYKTRESPNMYNWVRLDLAAGTGTVCLRRYSDVRGGFWAPDTMTYRNVSNGEYTFRLHGQASAEPSSLPSASPRPEPARQPQPAGTEPAAAPPQQGPRPEKRSRDVHAFEITIHPGSDDGWPVVARYRGPDYPEGVRSDGMLRLDLRELRAQMSPLDYGRMLGQALFQGDLSGDFRWALGKSDDDLHVLLSVEAKDLRPLRWERLCARLDDDWDHLALDQRTPFSLALPSYSTRRFPPIERPELRALLVVDSPEGLEQYGLDAFDTSEALAAVATALDAIRVPHEALETLPDEPKLPTLDRLVERLTRGGYTLLHLICHGRTLRDGETALYLSDKDGGVDPVSATGLIKRLKRLRSAGCLPYFAFLATCQSASPEAEGALGGLAHRLVRELGIPAVLAMTDRVTVDTAQALAQRFYDRLGEHGEPDRALVEATAPLAGRHDITVPALYSRLAGQPLFQERSRTAVPIQPDTAGRDVVQTEPGTQELLASLRIDADNPPYAALRDLLLEAFSADDLRRFCQERRSFRPVLSNISSRASSHEIIDALFELCRTRLWWDELLAELIQSRPEQVAAHADRLRASGS